MYTMIYALNNSKNATMLDDLALFIHVVEAGSLLAAANQLDIPPSTLTRRLQKLELQLGCRLLHRSTRNNVPTSEGWKYYEQCRLLVRALQENVENLDESLNQVKGIVRVLAPFNLANGLLAPAWASFMHKYPDIELSLHLSNQVESLINLNADLAIRVGKQPSSSLKMRPLGRISKMLLVASPDYIKHQGTPITPEQLHTHCLIISEPISIWELQHQQSKELFRITPQARFSVNEMALALKAACAGVGVLLCPLNICYEALLQGFLVPILPDWVTSPRDITMLWPEQKQLPARVRALIEHLSNFAATQPLINGEL